MNNIENPLVSAIIPVYNAGKYIKDGIDSLIANKYDNLEIICVNDGSSDNSLEILRELEKKYDNLIVVNQENKGVSIARNVAIDNAKGKYIVFLDADDLLDSRCLNECVELLEKNNADIVLFNNKFVLNDIDKGIIFDSKYYLKKCKICYAKENNYCTKFINTRNIIRRQFLIDNNVRFKENHIYEDWLYMIELYTHNPLCIFLDKPYYIYRRYDNHVHISLSTFENCLNIYKTYYISNDLIKKCNLNSGWKPCNDSNIVKIVSFFIDENKLLDLEDEKNIVKRYFDEFKKVIDDFSGRYLYILLKDVRPQMRDIIIFLKYSPVVSLLSLRLVRIYTNIKLYFIWLYWKIRLSIHIYRYI